MSTNTQRLVGLPLLVRIRYVRCGIHRKPHVKKTIQALGFRHLNQEIIHKNILPIRGMINVVCNPLFSEANVFW